MAGELILIIEDNDKNLKLVRDVLQFNGYQTAEAVTAITGVLFVIGSALSCRRAAKPSMPGNWMSSRMRAGCCDRAKTRPSSAVIASAVS